MGPVVNRSVLLLLVALLAPVARAQDGFVVSAWVEMEPRVEAKALAAAGRSLDEVDLFNFAINAHGGFAESALAGHRQFIDAAHARGARVSITFIDWVGSARLVVASSALSARFAATL